MKTSIMMMMKICDLKCKDRILVIFSFILDPFTLSIYFDFDALCRKGCLLINLASCMCMHD
jgi:hypothetical protein